MTPKLRKRLMFGLPWLTGSIPSVLCWFGGFAFHRGQDLVFLVIASLFVAGITLAIIGSIPPEE